MPMQSSKDIGSLIAEQTLGIYGPFDIPLEEYLFFIIIPLAAIMTIEAVTTVNKHWKQRYDV
jgi:hypothetical protein